MKDPKSPIVKKNLIKFGDKLLPILDVIKYPIKKDPNIFTDSVPKMLVSNNNLDKFVKKYLSKAPNAPPAATNIKFNNII